MASFPQVQPKDEQRLLPQLVHRNRFKSLLPDQDQVLRFRDHHRGRFLAQYILQAVLQAQPHLHTLGLIGWHFDAVGVVRRSFFRPIYALKTHPASAERLQRPA